MWADQPPGHHIAGYLSLLPWRSHPGQEMSQALPSRGPGLRGAGGVSTNERGPVLCLHRDRLGLRSTRRLRS